MEQGFVKVAAVTPKIKVADTKYNGEVICAEIKKAAEQGAKVIVLPELCITGYTCSDLFLQEKGMLYSMCDCIEQNKKQGVYDGAYKVVELAFAMKEKK